MFWCWVHIVTDPIASKQPRLVLNTHQRCPLPVTHRSVRDESAEISPVVARKETPGLAVGVVVASFAAFQMVTMVVVVLVFVRVRAAARERHA